MVDYLERNPAPGTEEEPTRPAVSEDRRAGVQHLANQVVAGTESPAGGGAFVRYQHFFSVATAALLYAAFLPCTRNLTH